MSQIFVVFFLQAFEPLISRLHNYIAAPQLRSCKVFLSIFVHFQNLVGFLIFLFLGIPKIKILSWKYENIGFWYNQIDRKLTEMDNFKNSNYQKIKKIGFPRTYRYMEETNFFYRFHKKKKKMEYFVIIISVRS